MGILTPQDIANLDWLLKPPTPPTLLQHLRDIEAHTATLHAQARVLWHQGDKDRARCIERYCEAIEADARGVVADWEMDWMEACGMC